MTPEEAARHDAPALPDDDADPPMERWVAVAWLVLAAVGALAFGVLVAMVAREVLG